MTIVFLLSSTSGQTPSTSGVTRSTLSSTISSSTQSTTQQSTTITTQPPQPVTITEHCRAYKNDIKEFYVPTKTTFMKKFSDFIANHDWTKYDPTKFEIKEIEGQDKQAPPLKYIDVGHKYLLITNLKKGLVVARNICSDQGKGASLFRIENYDDWKVVFDNNFDLFWVPLKKCMDKKEATYSDGSFMPTVTTDGDDSLAVTLDCTNTHFKYYLQTSTTDQVPKLVSLPRNNGGQFHVICQIKKNSAFLTAQRIAQSKDNLKQDIDLAAAKSPSVPSFNVLWNSIKTSPLCIGKPTSKKISKKLGVTDTFAFLNGQIKLSTTIIGSVLEETKRDFRTLAMLRHPDTINLVLEETLKGSPAKSTQGDFICDCLIQDSDITTSISQLSTTINSIDPCQSSCENENENEGSGNYFTSDQMTDMARRLYFRVSNQQSTRLEKLVPNSIPDPLKSQSDTTEDPTDPNSSYETLINYVIDENSKDEITLTNSDFRTIIAMIDAKGSADFYKMMIALPETDIMDKKIKLIVTEAMIQHLEQSHDVTIIRKEILGIVEEFERNNHIISKIDHLETQVAVGNIQAEVRRYLNENSRIKSLEFTSHQFLDHQKRDPTESQIRAYALEEARNYVSSTSFKNEIKPYFDEFETQIALTDSQKLQLVSELLKDQRFQLILTTISGLTLEKINDALESPTVTTTSKPTQSATASSTAAADSTDKSDSTAKPTKSTEANKLKENLEKFQDWMEELKQDIKELFPENIYQIIALLLSLGATVIGIINCYEPAKKKFSFLFKSKGTGDCSNSVALLNQNLPSYSPRRRSVTFDVIDDDVPNNNRAISYEANINLVPDLTN